MRIKDQLLRIVLEMMLNKQLGCMVLIQNVMLGVTFAKENKV